MKEALKLALEALEWINRVNAMDYEYQQKARETLNAIYEALAQDEQSSSQGPVALGYMNAGHLHEMQQGRLPYGYVYPKGGVGADIAVYTTPPKRPWVGLTDKEVRQTLINYNMGALPHRFDCIKAVEAALQEKNT